MAHSPRGKQAVKTAVFLLAALLIFCFSLVEVQADWDGEDWEEPLDFLGQREFTYESYGRVSGFRSHKWKLDLSQKRSGKAGFFLIRNETQGTPAESHTLGVSGSRNFRWAGFKGSYALQDRSLSGAQGKNFVSGGLRLSPFPNLDLLLDYDRIKEEFISGEEDLEKEAITAGFRLRASDAFRMKLVYAGQNRMRVKVSCRW